MTTRTMNMLMNDFGMNRQRPSSLLRVTKPTSHAIDALVLLAELCGRGVERTLEALEGWYRRQRTYRELARLDDHLLRDIGLTRDGIPSCIAQLDAERRRQTRMGRRI